MFLVFVFCRKLFFGLKICLLVFVEGKMSGEKIEENKKTAISSGQGKKALHRNIIN